MDCFAGAWFDRAILSCLRWTHHFDVAFSVSDVEIDPRCPTRMYATAGYGGEQHRHGGGLFVSFDGGSHWEAMTTGTDVWRTPITDVAIAPDDSRVLYVATFGQGIWAFVWTGPLPPCAP